MADLFIGIDVGTSGTKALLLDAAGPVVATATAEHPILMPRPGWSEQRPDDWWVSARRAVRTLLRRGRAAKGDIRGIGLSGQMHGSVMLDGRRRPVANAMLWNDQRTEAECREIEQRAGGRDELIRLVRNVALTGFTAPKVLWLRRHKPRLFARVRTLLLPKDYIRYRLTGTLGGDVSDASGTLLFDVARRQWSTELMQKLDLDPAIFPPAAESQQIIGELTGQAARALGLRAGVPVGAGDQPAAAVGAGIVRTGRVSATIGTSGVVFAHSDAPVPIEDGLLQSFCHAVPNAWCVFGCMLSAGGSLQWARRVLAADRLAKARTPAARDAIYDDLLAEAAAAPPESAGASKLVRESRSPRAASAQSRGAGPAERPVQGPAATCSSKQVRDSLVPGLQSPNAVAPDDLLFLPYLTGERCPYPHPHARGAWIGLSARHERGALVRAVVEGVTLGMERQLQLMRSAGVPIREVRLAGGGARNAWWRQLQADVYGVRCAAMESEEGSALGAAILAAVGTGRFRSVEAACRSVVRVRETVRPSPPRTRRYRALSRRAVQVYETIEPLYRS
jgi:xylulokinase